MKTAFVVMLVASAARAAAPASEASPVVFLVTQPLEDEPQAAIPIACPRTTGGKVQVLAGQKCVSGIPKGARLSRGHESAALTTRLTDYSSWCGYSPGPPEDKEVAVPAYRLSGKGFDLGDVPAEATRSTVAVWPASKGKALAAFTRVAPGAPQLKESLQRISLETKVPVEKLKINEAIEFDADGDGVPDRWLFVTEPGSGKYLGHGPPSTRIHNWTYLLTSASGVHLIPAWSLLGAIDLDGDGKLELITLTGYEWAVLRLDGAAVLEGPGCSGEG